MTTRKRLFSPAVGSKVNSNKYPIDDFANYDVVVEPFAQAGPIVIDRLLKFCKVTGSRYGFISDSDPSVYSIWQTWLHEGHRKVCDDIIAEYHGKISDFAATADQENFKDNDFYETLKNQFDVGLEGYLTYGEMAAYSLLVRKLVYGGVIRCNTKGKLNVTLSYHKLKAFSRWKHKWHVLDPLCNVDISTDYRICLQNLLQSECKRALVLIDPPYWLPYEPGSKRRGTGAMTPAYAVHKPSDTDTFKMGVDSVNTCLASGVVKRLVHTNYWSRPMQLAMEEASRVYGVPVYTTLLTTLTGMNRTRTNTTNRIECAWEFGGKRMFWPEGFVPIEQIELVA